MADRAEQPLRVRAGQFINLAGLVLFPAGLGAVGGFYAADQGMRWLPSMLQIVLALVVVSLLSMAVGRWLAREAVVETSRGWRVRRRVIVCLGDSKKLTRYFDTPEVNAWVARQDGGRHETLAGLLRGRWPGRWRDYELGQQGHKNRVLEAISEGVVFNTLGHAAGDYFAALRPRLSRLDKARAVLEAFRHVGKPYDFDFDYFIDATEKERLAFVADEAAFLESVHRPQWDIVQK